MSSVANTNTASFDAEVYQFEVPPVPQIQNIRGEG